MTVKTIIMDVCDLCLDLTHMQYQPDRDVWSCINCNSLYTERD